MIKGHHRIAPIVAVMATVAKEGRMIGHEERISGRMACLAVNLVRSIARPLMAVFAKNGAIIVITLVFGQAKAGQPIMLERLQIIGGQIRLPPPVLGMALCAIPGIRQVAMHAGLVGALLDYISVTNFTAVGRATLPGRMTSGALGLEIGMGREAG
jgi:hypothetical protein